MISEETCKQWAPLWRDGFHIDRPWWHQPDPEQSRWVRADGMEIIKRGGAWTVHLPGDAPQYPNGPGTADAAMHDYDSYDPLPIPDPMPGQVWVREGTSLLITRVMPLGDGEWMLWFGEGPATYALDAPEGKCHWPIPRAVLVAGPTPWGRDVPWAP